MTGVQTCALPIFQTVALIAPDIVEREGLRACEITLEYPFPPDDSRLPKIYPTVTRGIDLLRAQGKTVSTVPTARILCEQEPNPASRVTVTRAKDRLYLCRAERRAFRGKVVARTPSRFLTEIPETLLERSTETTAKVVDVATTISGAAGLLAALGVGGPRP